MKQFAHDFAIFGGLPAFENSLLVGRPNIPHREKLLQRVGDVLDSGMLTNGGPMTQSFETQLSKKLGVRHVVAVCNGTVALQIMAMACRLQGEVIVPSMTFIATAHALAWIGLTPIFADVHPVTHTVDPVSVQRCINQRTAAIMGVHLWGNLCDNVSLKQIAEDCGLPLLFDASHAFGCSRDHLAGCEFGDAEAISFHATKTLHAVEGGAVITDDDAIAERCRLIRNFGISGFTKIDLLGTNGKMNELCAAAGLTCLEGIDDVITINNRNLLDYRAVVDAVPGLQVAVPQCETPINAQYVVVAVDVQQFGLSRDRLIEVLHAEGIFARAYFSPGCHNSPPYLGHPVHTPVPLPVTDSLLESILQLPTGPSVSTFDIDRIGKLLGDIHRHSKSLNQHSNVSRQKFPEAA